MSLSAELWWSVGNGRQPNIVSETWHSTELALASNVLPMLIERDQPVIEVD
jgi:hypothetical protein